MRSSGSIYSKKKLMFSDSKNLCAVYNDVGHFYNLLNQKMASSFDGIIRLEGDFTFFNDEKKIRSKG